MIEAKEWFDQAAISEPDRAKHRPHKCAKVISALIGKKTYLVKAGVIVN
jgi:hypothetical protein